MALSGGLTGPAAAGEQRRMQFYMERRGDGYEGAVTLPPEPSSGLIGVVSYWVHVVRK
jgi:hypothetical protein